VSDWSSFKGAKRQSDAWKSFLNESVAPKSQTEVPLDEFFSGAKAKSGGKYGLSHDEGGYLKRLRAGTPGEQEEQVTYNADDVVALSKALGDINKALNLGIAPKILYDELEALLTDPQGNNYTIEEQAIHKASVILPPGRMPKLGDLAKYPNLTKLFNGALTNAKTKAHLHKILARGGFFGKDGDQIPDWFGKAPEPTPTPEKEKPKPWEVPHDWDTPEDRTPKKTAPRERTPVDVEEVPDAEEIPDTKEVPDAGTWERSRFFPDADADGPWSKSGFAGSDTYDPTGAEEVPSTSEPTAAKPQDRKVFYLADDFQQLDKLKGSWNSVNRNKGANVNFKSDLDAFVNFIGPYLPEYVLSEKKTSNNPVEKIADDGYLKKNKERILLQFKNLSRKDPKKAEKIERMSKIFMKKQARALLNVLMRNVRTKMVSDQDAEVVDLSTKSPPPATQNPAEPTQRRAAENKLNESKTIGRWKALAGIK